MAHGSGALLTTAVDSRCATSETKGNWCVSVLSRVLDLRETAKSGRSGRALWNAAQRNRTEEYSEESADVEQAITQMRQDLQELQIAMQHQQSGLIQQHAHVTGAPAGAQTAKQDRADMAGIAGEGRSTSRGWRHQR